MTTTLCIDIGGTGLKAALVALDGTMISGEGYVKHQIDAVREDAWLLKGNADHTDLLGRFAGDPRVTGWCVQRSYRLDLMRAGQPVLFITAENGVNAIPEGLQQMLPRQQMLFNNPDPARPMALWLLEPAP